jgi:hypothetical protein
MMYPPKFCSGPACAAAAQAEGGWRVRPDKPSGRIFASKPKATQYASYSLGLFYQAPAGKSTDPNPGGGLSANAEIRQNRNKNQKQKVRTVDKKQTILTLCTK